MRAATLLVCSIVILLAWWLPNRLQNPAPLAGTGRFNSLSFEPYRDWESPLLERFPTEAEADADLALLAPVTRAIRTYSAVEGNFDIAALAAKHGMKLWQGIWLGGSRTQNAREIARGIALANQYPGTIERVIVGNEVLLRRDLPVSELIDDIERVRRAVRQPVAYADVWEFWRQFPEVAAHVDVMLIHLLPYWEDDPTGIDHAVDHAAAVLRQMREAFPHTTIAIGETGWPSRGRPRRDAVPGRVNQARFMREFIALAHQEHFDYNLFEGFDERWKYASEGIVGANWGIFSSDHHSQKVTPAAPLREDPLWAWHAAVSLAAGWLLAALGNVGGGRGAAAIAIGMALGAALGFASAGTLATLYDRHLLLAAAANLTGQTLLAALVMLRLAGRLPAAPAGDAAQATRHWRALLRRGRLPPIADWHNDLLALFAWSAGVLQLLLVCDGRYREFPLGTFAVPLVATALAAARGQLAAPGRLEWTAALVLAGGALVSASIEGPLNMASLVWNAGALGWGVAIAFPRRDRFVFAILGR